MASIDDPGHGSSAGAAGEEAYDLVVVGAGIAGLTVGALVARAGRSVLVVEADDRPGGYAHVLHYEGDTFDRADHLISDCEPAGPFGQGAIDAVLREFEVREQCQFVRVDDPFYVARYPGFDSRFRPGTRRTSTRIYGTSRPKRRASADSRSCAVRRIASS